MTSQAVKGVYPERVAALETQLGRMQTDLESISSRVAPPTFKSEYTRLAKILGPVQSGWNTYEVMFLDGDFSESSGMNSPTYAERQLTEGSSGYAHNLGDRDMAVGEVIEVDRISRRWWFHAGGTTEPGAIWSTSGWFDPETSGTLVFNETPLVGNTFRYGYSPLGQTIRQRYSGHLAFQVTGINSGDTITSATLEFTSAPTWVAFASIWTGGFIDWIPDGRKWAKADIYAEDIDHSPLFYGTAAGYRAATRTTASVAIDYWTDIVGNNQFAQYFSGDMVLPSIDVTAPVQEVINRPGWSSGNRLRLLLDENGSDKGFNVGYEWGIVHNNEANIDLVIT